MVESKILFHGPPQSGKTTLIQRILAQSDRSQVGGFLTRTRAGGTPPRTTQSRPGAPPQLATRQIFWIDSHRLLPLDPPLARRIGPHSDWIYSEGLGESLLLPRLEKLLAEPPARILLDEVDAYLLETPRLRDCFEALLEGPSQVFLTSAEPLPPLCREWIQAQKLGAEKVDPETRLALSERYR